MKILQVLGGEVQAESALAENTNPTTKSPNQQSQTENDEAFIGSE